MRIRVAFVVLAFLAVSVGLRAAEDSMTGTWKLNVAKSKYTPGPAPQGEINHVDSYGANGIKVTADITDAQGKKINLGYSGNFDGKESPVTGDPNADTCSLKRIDARTMQRTNKKAGKVTTTMLYVVSKDGKTKTVRTTGMNLQRQKINNVAVFEKQ
jgi:hypothetical protein